MFIITLSTNSIAYGLPLDVRVNSNPTSVEVSDTLRLDTVIINTGIKEQNITSINLLSPDWNIVKGIKTPFVVDVNQSRVQTLMIEIPNNLNAGVYNIIVGVILILLNI